ncbi:MAG: HAMP domain-containing sensor histidine kinase [Bacteroidota bacterium]
MILNTLTFVFVSIITQQSETEQRQAALFVDIEKYLINKERPQIWNGNVTTDALKDLLQRVLGNPGADKFIRNYQNEHGEWHSAETADPNMVPYVETILAGAVGTASARILISSVTEDENLKFEDLIDVARESKELLLLNKKLKQQSAELKKATDELKEANEKLLTLDREKDVFISTVTHELRTPITSIRSFSEILYDNEDLSREEQADFLKIIVRETERISRLISQVLDLEKLQSGTSKLEFKLESLTQIAKESVDSLTQQAIEKKLNLVYHANGSEIFWKLNKDRITQVMINLLSNAIKYHDKPSGDINMHLSADNEIAKIIVSDNGPGMEKAYYEKVFEKFYQIRKKDNIKEKGVGLGLAITKSIVDKHNGKITIESEPGSGTVISVHLPKIN